MMYTVYLIKHKESGKSYVGCTIRPLEKRMKQHIYTAQTAPKTAIHHAIKKYGASAFVVNPIEICMTVEKMHERERYWIAELDTRAPNGYNLTDGGDGVIGYVYTEEHKQKISAANKGRKWSEEAKARMSEVARQRDAEHLQKIAESRIGVVISDTTKQKLRDANLGKKQTAETIEKRAAKLRGGTHTEEARAHMSQAQKGRIVDAEHRSKIAKTLSLLTDHQAATIRFDTLGLTGKGYAELYGISQQTVSGIRKGRTYKHVGREHLDDGEITQAQAVGVAD